MQGLRCRTFVEDRLHGLLQRFLERERHCGTPKDCLWPTLQNVESTDGLSRTARNSLVHETRFDRPAASISIPHRGLGNDFSEISSYHSGSCQIGIRIRFQVAHSTNNDLTPSHRPVRRLGERHQTYPRPGGDRSSDPPKFAQMHSTIRRFAEPPLPRFGNSNCS